jgi:hypothetical protein
MANRRIKINYGRTIQDRPYHSIHLDIGVERDIPDDADLKVEFDKTINGLSKYAQNKLQEIAKRQNS